MFAPHYKCFQCGSSLGQVMYLHGRLQHHCFICCAGEWDLLDCEIEGLSIEQIKQISGREPGLAGQILTRLAIPGRLPSSLQMKIDGLYSDGGLTIHTQDLIKLK